jgi:hypothetical protein
MEYIQQYEQAAKAPAPVINDRVNEINTKSHELAETIVKAMAPANVTVTMRTHPVYMRLKTDVYMGLKGAMQADLYQNTLEFDTYEFWLEFLETAIVKLRKFFVDPTDPSLVD